MVRGISHGGRKRANDGGDFAPRDSLRAPESVDLRGRADASGATVVLDSAELLQPLVKALMRAVSTSDVAAAVVAYGTATTDARWARVVLLDHTGRMAVALLGGRSLPSRRLDTADVGLPCPWMDAIAYGCPLEFDSTHEVRHAYPGIDDIQPLPGEGAVITLPLGSPGPPCGAVTFGFDEPGPLTDRVRRVAAEVASLTAYASRRALVYDAENRAAEMLQNAYLPDRIADVSGLTFASRFLSASEPWGVAGDWCDVLPLPGPLVGMVMGDVAGHGIMAATTMAALRGAVRAFSTVDPSPAAILARMNTYMGLFKPDAFATLIIAVFDPTDATLRFARAGHPPPVLLHPDGSAELLEQPLGPPLGVPDAGYTETELPFSHGSTLLIYTDGLIERRYASLDRSMADLIRTSSHHGSEQPEHLCDRLVERFARSELRDDVSLLVVVRDGQAEAVSTNL